MYFLVLNFIRDQKIVSFSNGVKRKLFCEDIKLFTEESIKLLLKPQRKKSTLEGMAYHCDQHITY